MLIPSVIKAEAHSSLNDDMPTMSGSEASKLWCAAALSLSRKLVECGRIKMRCVDIYDPDGAEAAFRFAKELLQLSRVLEGLPALQPEMAAAMRRASVDRVMKLYEATAYLLPMLAAAASAS